MILPSRSHKVLVLSFHHRRYKTIRPEKSTGHESSPYRKGIGRGYGSIILPLVQYVCIIFYLLSMYIPIVCDSPSWPAPSVMCGLGGIESASMERIQMHRDWGWTSRLEQPGGVSVVGEVLKEEGTNIAITIIKTGAVGRHSPDHGQSHPSVDHGVRVVLGGRPSMFTARVV